MPPQPGGVLPRQGGLQQVVPPPHAASPQPPRRVQGLAPEHGACALLRGGLRHGGRVHPRRQEAERGRLQGQREPPLPAAHQGNPVRVLRGVLPGEGAAETAKKARQVLLCPVGSVHVQYLHGVLFSFIFLIGID